MKILKYQDLEIVENFLNSLFSLTESSEDIFNNSFLNKLKIHKIFVDKYKDVLPILDKITLELIKNSGLNVETTDKVISLFCVAALSVCELKTDVKVDKNEYEKEVKSILEELKLNGIGNGLVKNLSEFFDLAIDLAKKIFKTKTILYSLKEPNYLQALLSFIDTKKISINDFTDNFEQLINIIAKIYLKDGKLDKFKEKINRLKQDVNVNKISTINEFNL